MSQTVLVDRHCVACTPGTPPLDPGTVQALLAELGGGWQIERPEGHDQLVKSFRFRGFVAAVDFLNRITPVAEAEGHHPDVLIAWGRARVQLWTHAAGGLTENDFVLAAKIDRLTG